MRFLTGALMVLALLAGCAPPPPAPAPSVPADFPTAFYRQAAAQGEPVYVLDAAHSLLRIAVHSGGPLARLGHEHVVSSRELRGYVLLTKEPERIRADLYLPLDSLVVDDPALGDRGHAALSPADIAATRRHMLDDVLDAPRRPFAVIHARCSPDNPSCAVLAAEVTLHGVTRPLTIPVEWRLDGARLAAKGRFSIRHRDFGLVPYSVLGGVLQVAEELDLDFQIEARPASAE